MLKKFSFDTPLGWMVAISNEEALVLLEFRDHNQKLNRKINALNRATIPGTTQSIISIQDELLRYHEGTLEGFKTPFHLSGTSFQQRTWKALQTIPYGKTVSYGDLASAIGRPTSCRAVAQAVGANRFAILIPCHRVINKDGKLGGYAGGVTRKQSLLSMEQTNRDRG